MKKILLILLIAIMGVANADAQKTGNITSSTDVDSLILETYNGYAAQLTEMGEQYQKLTNEKQKAKLSAKYQKLTETCDQELISIYKKYINVEGVIQRVFSIRKSIAKSELQGIYNDISPMLLTQDPFAASLKSYIDGYQISVGDTIGNFKATTSSGYDFNYSEFRNEKDLLLIFGDFESMANDVKAMLSFLYLSVDISKLEFVSYMNATDNKALYDMAVGNQVQWLVISDFRGDHSPLKLAFDVAIEPSMVYISKGGAIDLMVEGMDDILIEKIQANSF